MGFTGDDTFMCTRADDFPYQSARGQWGRHVEFILTLIGYAVGLGNIWRFPYLCYKNGGGAFLIPFFLCMLLLGIPIFALETAFGQYGGRGPTRNWVINPAFKGVGISMVMVTCLVAPYYGVVIGWGIYYLVASCSSELPWMNCTHCSCLKFEFRNLTMEQLRIKSGVDCADYKGLLRPVTEHYFQDVVLASSASISDLGEIRWQLTLYNLLGWALVFLTLCKGIGSLSKVAYFTSIMPYVIMSVLLANGLRLPGALDGLQYFLMPDFSKLKSIEIWEDAAVQIFFSLGVGEGGLIALSSYNNFHNNILRDSVVVPFINGLTSIFAGLVVFASLGHIAYIEHVAVKHVTESGPGLAFVVYPAVLGKMSQSVLWSILFFLLFCLLGLSSQFSMVETVITAVLDEYPWIMKTMCRQVLCRFTICLLGFLLGLPFLTQAGHGLLHVVDNTVVGVPVLVICLLELIALINIYGYRNFSRDVVCMTGTRPVVLFPCWILLSPLVILALLVMSFLGVESWTKLGYPPWTDVFAWTLVAAPLVTIPVWFVYYVWPRTWPVPHGLWKHIKRCNQSLPEYQLKRIEQFSIGPCLPPRPSHPPPPPPAQLHGKIGQDRLEMTDLQDPAVYEPLSSERSDLNLV